MKARIILAAATSFFIGGYTASAAAQPPKPQPPQTSEGSLQRQNAAERGSETGVESSEQGFEFLSRGPLHEAFASPYQGEAVANPTIEREPPKEINELPPEFQPAGENVVWIPGYWAWESEADDFLWISGVWRDVPPGERWIPGYWQEVKVGEYRWVRGFWADAEAQQLSYLPEPPESKENGPSTAAPDDSYFYIPGNWSYVDNDYRWVPGYWVPAQQDWVWVPAQYVWTPRGYVYAEGYWDYTLNDRGIVFTPVRFQQAVYVEPNFVYRPRYVVDAGAALLVHLFYRPQSRQYYFGDYYGSNYGDSFNPWVSYYGKSKYYDPLFTYYQRQNVGNQNAIGWLKQQNDYFARNQNYRPARTVADQRKFLQGNISVTGQTQPDETDTDLIRAATLVDELELYAKRNNRSLKFRPVNQEEARTLRNEMMDYDNKMIQQRREFEVAGRAVGRSQVESNAEISARPNGMKIPSFVDRTNSRVRDKDRKDWLTPEQIQRGKEETRKFRTKQEISNEALQRISEQGIAAREYWENMRMQGRTRPDGTSSWPLLRRNSNNFTPPNRPQGRKTAIGSIPTAPSTANNLGSGNNSGSGGAGVNRGGGLLPKGKTNPGRKSNNRGNRKSNKSNRGGGKKRGN